ncbi:uncharacterized protein LOC144861259 isoform X2 [Branchiostoma floridae x Branchiostoma japonicum]
MALNAFFCILLCLFVGFRAGNNLSYGDTEQRSGITYSMCHHLCSVNPSCVGFDYDSTPPGLCYLHYQHTPTTTEKLFQMWRVIFSLLALTADPDVWAFPTGAPTSVCDSMFPSHEAGAQGSLSPYELVVNKDTYAGGEEVQDAVRSSTQIRGT